MYRKRQENWVNFLKINIAELLVLKQCGATAILPVLEYAG